MEVDEPVPVVKKKKKRETAEEAPKEKKTTKVRVSRRIEGIG